MKILLRLPKICLHLRVIASIQLTLKSLECQQLRILYKEIKTKYKTLRMKTNVSIESKRCRTKKSTIVASLQRCLNLQITKDNPRLQLWLISKSEVAVQVAGVKWINDLALVLVTARLASLNALLYQTGTWSLRFTYRAQLWVTILWLCLHNNTAVWYTLALEAFVCAASRLCFETS